MSQSGWPVYPLASVLDLSTSLFALELFVIWPELFVLY